MSESFIEPSSLNTTFQSLSAIIDDGGATRFLNSELSSYNFDGFIPQETDTVAVSLLKVGNSFLAPGDSLGTLRTVLKIEFDDPEMTDSPTTDYIISYLGDGGEVQSVVYDATDEVEIYYEDWDNKVLGSNGWIITQAGNAIFSNVAIRGRIEATEGFLENLDITGTLNMDTGGVINIGTDPGTPGNAGIIIGDTGIFAYDDDENETFILDAATGDITIFGTPGDDLLTGGDVSDGGTTIISANRITTGSVTGRVFRSNSTMTPTSGNGVYLDGDGNVRFRNSNATLTFNSTGLSLSGAGLTIGGTDPNNFLEAADVGSSGTTTISGNRITTGVIDSAGYGGVTDGSVFAPGGMAINLDNGTITAREFRIDAAGNAHFSGDLSAAGGTFSGTLSAGVSIDSPVITGGTITGGTFKTSTGANRIEITSSNDIDFYFSNAKIATIDAQSTILGSVLKFSSAFVDMTGALIYGSTFFGSFSGNGSNLTSLPAPTSIPASSINSGTLDDARIPNLGAGKITSGVFARARVENVQETAFTNAQSPLQVRTSDGRVGTFSSTINIKENIIPLNGIQSSVVPEGKNGIGKTNLVINPDNIFNITSVEYSIVDEDSTIKEVGFIVEDLLEKWPAAVTYDKNGKPDSYNTNSIVSGLIYAIQNLKNRIDELESRIENG